MNTANHLLDCRVAFDGGEQAGIEYWPQPARDRGTLDGALIGAGKEEAIDFLIRQQQFGDRSAAAVTGLPTFRTTNRAMQENFVRQTPQIEPVDQRWR